MEIYVNRPYFPCWCIGPEHFVTIKAFVISFSASRPLADLISSQFSEDSCPVSEESCGSFSSSLWRTIETSATKAVVLLLWLLGQHIYISRQWAGPSQVCLSPLPPTSNYLIKFIYPISPSIFSLIHFICVLWSSPLVSCHPRLGLSDPVLHVLTFIHISSCIPLNRHLVLFLLFGRS